MKYRKPACKNFNFGVFISTYSGGFYKADNELCKLHNLCSKVGAVQALFL